MALAMFVTTKMAMASQNWMVIVDDTNPDIHPNAPQSCGGLVDDNCDGIIPAVLEISTGTPTAVGNNFSTELTVIGGTSPFTFSETHTGTGIVTLNTFGVGVASINAPANVDWEVTVDGCQWL